MTMRALLQAPNDGMGGGDMGGGGEAVVDPGGGDSPQEPQEPQGGQGAEQQPAALTGSPARYKYRRGQEEREASGDELAAMLSDDYEDEFSWGEGERAKKVRVTRPDVQRALQQREGYLGMMQQYKERLTEHQQQIEYGKQNPLEFFAGHLGLDKYESSDSGPGGMKKTGVDAWIYDRAREIYKRDAEVAELLQTNPTQAAALMRQQQEATLRRENAMRQHAEQQQRQQQQQRESSGKRKGELQSAFRDAGVPWNSVTEHLLQQEFAKLTQAGMDARELSPRDLAAYTSEALHKHALGVVDSHQGPALLKLLGDKRRQLLRELELAAVKAERKESRQQQRAAEPSSANGEKRRSGSVTNYKRGLGVNLG